LRETRPGPDRPARQRDRAHADDHRRLPPADLV